MCEHYALPAGVGVGICDVLSGWVGVVTLSMVALGVVSPRFWKVYV